MNLGVSNKLLLGYAIILFLLVAMGILMFVTFDNVKRNADALVRVENQTRVFSKVKFGSRNLLLVNDFIVGGNSWMHDYYLPETKLVNEQIGHLTKLPLQDNQRMSVEQLKKEFISLHKWTVLIVFHNRSKDTKGREWDTVLENLDYHASHIVELLETLSSAFELELAQAKTNHDHSIDVAKNFIVFIFFLSIAISLIVALKTNKIITHPLEKLNDFTIKVAKGDLTERLIIKSDDEIGELASSFNVMVSQLERSKAALLKSDEQHRLLFNNNPLPMFIYSLENLSILEVNEAMVRQYGYSREEFKEMTISKLLPEEDIPALDQAIAAVEKSVNKKTELRHQTKDKTMLNVEVNSTTIGYMDKAAIMVVVNDITIKKKAESELLKANKLAEESIKSKEIFLANMSHEIRTPMNAIIGMTELLQRTELNKKQMKYFNAVNISAKHLLIIINDILDISKIESGKLQFETVGFRVDQVFDSLVKSLEYRAVEKSIYLHHKIENEASVMLSGDPVRLKQILLNLLSNALKFTIQGEVVLMCKVLKDSGDKLLLAFTVSDTGIGIPEDKKETIFESFNQVDASTTRKFGGTGLGLSICKNLVMLQGGEIFVESELGKGTTFGFMLMYPKGTEVDLPQEDEEIVDYGSLGQLDVLLVEDHEMNQLMALTVLEQWNCKVDTADNGSIAIEKIKNKNYDIVLMDIQMPVMGGIEATEIIRNEMPDPKSSVPIIAITANALKGDREKYIAAGMNEYISKPFESHVLYRKIANLIKDSNGEADHSQQELGKSNTLLLAEDVGHPKLYDLNLLKKISNGNDDVVLEMIESFIETVAESLAELDEFSENKEWDRLSATAHRMRPSLDVLGICGIEKEIRLIERYARERKNTEKLPGLVAKLNHICDKVTDGLQDDIKDLSDKTLT